MDKALRYDTRILVAAPARADGVGSALRAAFGGCRDATPADMRRLLQKLG